MVMKQLQLLIIFYLLGSLYPPIGSAAAKEFFVSLESNSRNLGTRDNPFCSLRDAQLAVRKYKAKHPEKPVTVWLRKGVYELSGSFELNKYDSGTPTGRITYTAYPGEAVTLMGGRMISVPSVRNCSDTPLPDKLNGGQVVDKLKVVDLAALGITDYGQLQPTGFRRPYVNAAMELFINGRPFQLARYPNSGMLQITPDAVIDDGITDHTFYPGSLRFDKEKLTKWSKARDIFTCGNYKYAWATDQLRVKRIDPVKGEVSFADAHMFGISGDHEWNQYYFFNLLEELDSPGEYYIDRINGLLYFYPYDDISPTDSLYVSVLETPLIAIKGANYISIENIVVEAGRGIGVYMEETNENVIQNCIFRNLGVLGVCVGKGSRSTTIYGHPDEQHPFLPQEKISEAVGSLYDYLYENPVFVRDGGKNNGIVNCEFQNIGCGGVSLGGGNRLTLEKAGNYIRQCEFTNCGRLDYSYKAPVNIDGVGNLIQHCQFNTCPATAIYIHGNEHVIEYNVIERACTFMDDQGAVYLGRDPSEFGNIIRYNFFKEIGNIGTTVAVYYDDGASGTLLYGNVFYKAGTRSVLIGGGHYNTVENNIFIQSPVAIHLDNRFASWAKNSIVAGGIFEVRLNAVNYLKPPYVNRYPELTNFFKDNPAVPKENVFRNNVFVHVQRVYDGKKEWGPAENENYITNQDIGFENDTALNFNLKADALIFRKLPDFKSIPFYAIGRKR